MEIKVTLQLPRDALSVPVVRRVLATSMHTLGVEADCVEDIGIALTEACTNVLDHAAGDDEYEVVAGIDDNICTILVVDTGRGFDAAHLGHAEADPNAEEGRGIQLIRALVDKVRFQSRPENGMVVRLEKTLAFRDGSAIQKLAERTPLDAEIDLTRVEAARREGAAAID
ncbi:MAG: serine/threonine-protein kinase RsbW [Frankiaceae bacterium]|nr:serine/threonine-protein kinase RsbW [Frankiaceae bacterium]